MTVLAALAALRNKMVSEQLAPRGIVNPRILEAMARIERHRFIPEEDRDKAYEDCPAPIGFNQTISQPYIVALMTQSLGIRGGEKVLEIGTGSGYQTALLAELAGTVYSVERVPGLSRTAAGLLGELGYSNIHLKVGDGSLGWKEQAPFDRIIITAACPRIPFPLEEQLRDNGTIVLPQGDSRLRQTLMIGRKKGGTISLSAVCDCVFVPLVGEFGMRG